MKHLSKSIVVYLILKIVDNGAKLVTNLNEEN